MLSLLWLFFVILFVNNLVLDEFIIIQIKSLEITLDML